MNSDDPEQVCVKILDGSMTYLSAEFYVSNALYGSAPDSDWEGLNAGKVSFVPTGDPCLQWFHENIQFLIETDVEQDCQVDREACIWHRDLYFDGSIGVGHNEWTYVEIFMETGVLSNPNSFKFAVNHEVGHALDLEEGGADCENEQGIPSIMHADLPDCQQLDFPSSIDRASVETHIPDAPSGYFGGKSEFGL